MYISVDVKSLGELELNPCQVAFQEQLRYFIEGLDSISLVERRSHGIKKQLNEFGASGVDAQHRFTWKTKVRLADTSSLTHDPNFVTTAQMKCSSCSVPSILYIHLAVSNREGIGTHLLRSNLAWNCEYGSGPLLLITLGRDLLNLGGWDSSYGDSEEFLTQYELGYKEAISPPPVIMEINSPPQQ